MIGNDGQNKGFLFAGHISILEHVRATVNYILRTKYSHQAWRESNESGTKFSATQTGLHQKEAG